MITKVVRWRCSDGTTCDSKAVAQRTENCIQRRERIITLGAKYGWSRDQIDEVLNHAAEIAAIVRSTQ